MEDDNALFERLMLEINQAGLSWATILKKRDAFRQAFAGFDIARVARFTARDRRRLMRNEGIIRNAKKIDAAVRNLPAHQPTQAEMGHVTRDGDAMNGAKSAGCFSAARSGVPSPAAAGEGAPKGRMRAGDWRLRGHPSPGAARHPLPASRGEGSRMFALPAARGEGCRERR
jgi:hypothetical protein